MLQRAGGYPAIHRREYSGKPSECPNKDSTEISVASRSLSDSINGLSARWGGENVLKARMLLILPLIAGCARAGVMPLAQDTIQITSSAAPACGRQGAQKVAFQRAAVETIRRGYDRFIIIGGQAETDIRVIGYTPTQAYSTGSATATGYGNRATAYGSSTTTVTGGQPIYGGSHNQGLVVKMFRDGDPAGANALPARETLGPDWQDAVSKNKWTCWG